MWSMGKVASILSCGSDAGKGRRQERLLPAVDTITSDHSRLRPPSFYMSKNIEGRRPQRLTEASRSDKVRGGCGFRWGSTLSASLRSFPLSVHDQSKDSCLPFININWRLLGSTTPRQAYSRSIEASLLDDHPSPVCRVLQSLISPSPRSPQSYLHRLIKQCSAHGDFSWHTQGLRVERARTLAATDRHGVKLQ